MNDLLTPLAIVGIVLFGVACVFVALYFLQQARDVVRLIRSGRVKVDVSFEEAPPELERYEAPPPSEPGPVPEERRGWGFDR